jgi:hypothetical protein
MISTTRFYSDDELTGGVSFVLFLTRSYVDSDTETNGIIVWSSGEFGEFGFEKREKFFCVKGLIMQKRKAVAVGDQIKIISSHEIVKGGLFMFEVQNIQDYETWINLCTSIKLSYQSETYVY